MSAVYGIFGAADPPELTAIGDRLPHRGSIRHEWSPCPDVHFGQRLKGNTGDPPAFIVFDGALDNAIELIRLLGIAQSAAEAIPDRALAWQLYQRYGLDGFGYLRGQFALALWDQPNRRIVMARDRWGSRNIWYTRSRGRILFASEYKALLAIADIPARSNPDAILYAVRTRHANPQLCFLAGIEAVPRASWLVLHQDRVESARYWDIEIDIAQRSEDAHAAAIRSALIDALGRQTATLDTIGLALSGGLDSALVLAGIRQVAPTTAVHTFTVGHSEEDAEIVGAREAAGHFKTSHHEIIVAAEDLPVRLPEAVWHMEDPVGGEEMIYQYIVAREAAHHVGKVFMGLKSDQLFGGMPRHLLVRLAILLRPIRGMLEEFFHYTQSRRVPRSMTGRLLVNLYFRGNQPPDVSVLGSQGLPLARPLPFDTVQPLSEKLRVDILEGASNLGTTYQLHAACGLSWDSPFIDEKFVQTAFQIPDDLKIRGLQQKYILRRAYEGLVPESILKLKKSLQRLRHDDRLTEVLATLSADLLSPQAVAARGIFKPAEVERVRRRPDHGLYSREQVSSLWTLLLTEIWAQLYLDGRGRFPTGIR